MIKDTNDIPGTESDSRQVIDPDFKPYHPCFDNPEVCICGASKYDPYCYCYMAQDTEDLKK